MPQAAPSRLEALSQLRSLLRASRLFTNYNFRAYVHRRALDGFRAHQNTTDSAALAQAFAKGQHELGVAQRQGAIDRLYKPRSGLVVEEAAAKKKDAFAVYTV
ncbi:catalytic/ oxidoreductase, acting on NADH or [Chytriomyces sp. MP71]|nr:catalytic/ oxidoreductase, acting on NADH or [Chytriomyces sp. MP71]